MKQIENPCIGKRYFVEVEITEQKNGYCYIQFENGDIVAYGGLEFYVESPITLGPGGTHNPVTGRPYKFDPANWCVDITDERNRELLPKFKEWYSQKFSKNIGNYGIPFWGSYNSVTYNNMGNELNISIYTLTELKTHMPEVFGVEEPEWGKEYEFQFENIAKWEVATFVGMNPNKGSKWKYLAMTNEDDCNSFKRFRPIPVTITDRIRNIAPELNDQQVEGLVKLLKSE